MYAMHLLGLRLKVRRASKPQDLAMVHMLHCSGLRSCIVCLGTDGWSELQSWVSSLRPVRKTCDLQAHWCGKDMLPRWQALYMRKRPQDAKAIHVMSSGLKAGATWSRVEILQVRAFASGAWCLCVHWKA